MQLVDAHGRPLVLRHKIKLRHGEQTTRSVSKPSQDRASGKDGIGAIMDAATTRAAVAEVNLKKKKIIIIIL